MIPSHDSYSFFYPVTIKYKFFAPQNVDDEKRKHPNKVKQREWNWWKFQSHFLLCLSRRRNMKSAELLISLLWIPSLVFNEKLCETTILKFINVHENV